MKKKVNLSKDLKTQIISEIKRYFLEERDEDIGDLAAALMLDFIIQHIGPAFYNQGIKDSIMFMNEKVDDMYCLEI